MRSLWMGFAALVFLVLLAEGVTGQATPGNPQLPSVQVGVPEGAPGGRPAGPGRGRQAGPPQPAPRNTAGRVLLGGLTPKDTGLWLPGPVIPNPLAMTDIPYQPWAAALAANRRTHQLEPHTRCKPSGVARVFLTPYGVEFVELPELQRVYIFDVGGPHTWRTVYLDGRSHPSAPVPTHYGHSIGWWEGDSLVVDTVGFNEDFWMDRGLLPHTTRLHTIERFTRVNSATLRYELTVDDPGAYTKPFSGATDLRWENGTELFEYVCQEANYAHDLMVGQGTSVDRTSPIVP
jgi:hypothetical protein